VHWLQVNAPRHAMLETLAAHVEAASGNRQEAESRFRQALRVYPDHRGLIYGYAELLLATGQWEPAIKLLKEKQTTFSWDPYLYELESQAWTQQGKNLDGALAAGLRTVELRPRAYYHWTALADLYAKMGKMPEALKAAERAVEFSSAAAKPAMQKKLEALKARAADKK